jgi:hypothetical protein
MLPFLVCFCFWQKVLGALYGPYYVYLGLGDSGSEHNLGFALCFAVAIQLTISGLYHVMLGYIFVRV